MSNKKSLLKENTIRRFMKLASIEPLTETFVDKMNEDEDEDDVQEEGQEEDVQEENLQEQNPLSVPATTGGSMPSATQNLGTQQPIPGQRDEEGLDLGDVDLEGEGEGEGEGAPEDMETALADLLTVVGDAVNDWAERNDVDVNVDVDKEGEEEGELEDLAGLEDLGPAPEDLGLPTGGEEEELPPEELAERLLKKVTHRVATRLDGIKRENARRHVRQENINRATEGIVNRIFSSVKK
tara:strand:- start:394 stop:1110 length:717 start_codon:yes stop_codon:yes gene_type:complete